jgi:guanylate kinase
MNFAHGLLFVLSGPTGSGKTTIAHNVLDRIAKTHNISRVITYTTRPPRPGERNGIDYHFLAPEDFLDKKNNNFFLETTTYDNHWYGSSREIIDNLARGQSFLLVIDRPGAKNIKNLHAQAVLIWVDVPSLQILEDRLKKRTAENETALKRRFAIATKEIEDEAKEKTFKYHVMNDNLDTAVQDVIHIINDELAAENYSFPNSPR